MKTVHLCAVAAALAIIKSKTRRKRTKWTKEWLLKISQFSQINLLKELKLEPGDWFKYLRMDYETYCNHLKLVTPLIEKRHTAYKSYYYYKFE